MNQKIIDDVFSLFLKDSYMGWMLQPNEQDGYVYATDGKSLVRIKKELCSKEFPPHEKVANFGGVLESIQHHDPLTVHLKRLLVILENIEKVPAVKDCPECDGEGKEECNLGHLHDCEDCNGTGEILDEKAPKEYPNYGFFTKIGEAVLAPRILNRLVRVMELTGVEKCGLIAGFNKPTKAQYFVVGDFEVLLMPVMHDTVEVKESKVYEYHFEQKPIEA